MATYQDIRGLRVKYLSADPSNTAAGEVWYNSTTGTLRSPLVTEAWSSAASMIDDKGAATGGGPQTAGIEAGGEWPYKSSSADYNGSGWATNPSLNTARGGLGGAKSGSQTAFLVFGGTSDTTATESFDGSAWTTTPNSLNTGKGQTSGAGTQGAALNAGKWGPPLITATEQWDGSSWASNPTGLNTARGDMASFGTQTAAIFAGGNSASPPSYRDLTEEFNGASWTANPILNTARGIGGSGAGISTLGLVAGGNTPGPAASAASERWNGTSWTNTPSLATAGSGRSGFGSSAAALAFGKYPYAGTTEEFNQSTTVTTPASWAAGGSLSNGLFGRSFTNQGTQNAGNVNGGYAPYSNATEEYNGASWTAGGTSANNRYFGSGGGTQTAGLVMGGGVPPSAGGGATNLCEEYNGASWSTGGNMPAPAANMIGGGTQTAGIAAGGTGPIVTTNFYDGSAWAAQPNNMNDGTRERTGCGTQSSFIAFGGANPTETAMSADTEEWNGTSWTQTGDLLIAAKSMSCMGHTALGAVANGGYIQGGGSIGTTQIFNGTSIETGVPNNPSNNNSGNQGCGTAALGFTAAKYVPATGTDEYVGETSAVNYRTLTTS